LNAFADVVKVALIQTKLEVTNKAP